MTVRFPSENLTRLPSPLGWCPARSRSTLASLSRSLYLPITARSSSPGAAPGSGSPLIINITRMWCLLPVPSRTSYGVDRVALARCSFRRCGDEQVGPDPGRPHEERANGGDLSGASTKAYAGTRFHHRVTPPTKMDRPPRVRPGDKEE